ncbi:Protein CBG25890 [Caenorhabditis briggsae]|uniref:Protein CBG25890 n=1 Tax=Caenorhabditis briggsae TaxID=6238 RepID=B6IHP5_CAEBR|nr:Protein CBG25890 [Caenorhabditis briggsae]CAR99401.1 Protein CBG25890 [Caenorhabditis briggsae]
MDSTLSDPPPSYDEAWERYLFTKTNFFIFWCLLMLNIFTAFYELGAFHIVVYVILCGVYIALISATLLRMHLILSVLFLALITTMITVTGIITVEYVLEEDLKPFTVTLLIGSIFMLLVQYWILRILDKHMEIREYLEDIERLLEAGGIQVM